MRNYKFTENFKFSTETTMGKLVAPYFREVLKDTVLKIDGNKHHKNFVELYVIVRNKKTGKLIHSYSATQHNVTGLMFQAERALQFAKYDENKHSLTIKVTV